MLVHGKRYRTFVLSGTLCCPIWIVEQIVCGTHWLGDAYIFAFESTAICVCTEITSCRMSWSCCKKRRKCSTSTKCRIPIAAGTTARLRAGSTHGRTTLTHGTSTTTRISRKRCQQSQELGAQRQHFQTTTQTEI